MDLEIALSDVPAPNAFGVETSGDVISLLVGCRLTCVEFFMSLVLTKIVRLAPDQLVARLQRCNNCGQVRERFDLAGFN